jgi:hypothetical protein
MDYQAYILARSWVTPYCVWCQSRGSGKTSLGAPFIIAKSILFPSLQSYIIAPAGQQSKEMFYKIENIAKKNIPSFRTLTDIFANETVKNTSNATGFTHSPESFQYELYNGSKTNTLNSLPDNIRGRRSQLNFYDEAGFSPEELIVVTEPFITQDSSFGLGVGSNNDLEPRQIPNQEIFASSASSIDTIFFNRYRDYAKKMFLGDNRYFVADIKDELVLKATVKGRLIKTPLLTEETINNAMQENPEKANREYKNIFSREGGETQTVKRATVIRNSTVKPPKLVNDYSNPNSTFGLAYDPARSYDNSIVVIGEFYEDPNDGYRMDLVNSVSFVDLAKKKKTPMRTPEQMEYLKEMILNYNGKQSADYENIEALLIDAGTGGGGLDKSDYLMENWKDKNGKTHRGLIDKTYDKHQDYIVKFPQALDKIRMLEPARFRNEIFDAMDEMINLDLVGFTADYDMKGHLNIFENKVIKDKEGKAIKNEDGKVEMEQVSHVYKLSFDEELALKNLDLTKEEIINIHKIKNDTKYRYSLPADKKNKMHDDRVLKIRTNVA